MKFTLGLMALVAVATAERPPQYSHLKNPKYNIEEFHKQFNAKHHHKVNHHKKHHRKPQYTHLQNLNEDDLLDENELIDVMPISVPFHSDVPVSEAYQKLIDDQEKDVEKSRKEYNDLQKDSDEKAR